MKVLLTTIGFALAFTCETFANEHTTLARVTICAWAKAHPHFMTVRVVTDGTSATP